MTHADRIAAQLAMAEDRCDQCGGQLVREGNCETCENCGRSTCGGEQA